MSENFNWNDYTLNDFFISCFTIDFPDNLTLVTLTLICAILIPIFVFPMSTLTKLLLLALVVDFKKRLNRFYCADAQRKTRALRFL